ncbi:MAG: hypothetical protein ABR915_17420, partial [Thermoguttaceae bacterium]
GKHGQPQLYCVPTGVPAAAADANLSRSLGVRCAAKPAWSRSPAEIGNPSAIIAVRNGALVATVSTKAGKSTGNLRLLAADDGAERWSMELPATVVHQGLAVDAAGIVAACSDGRVLYLAP